MNKKIRTGDQVLVITGNDKGKSGKVLARIGDKIIIEGINIKKKHLKKSQTNPKGQIIDIERPIHISNVKICVEGNQPVKLKVRQNQNGEKEFFYRQDNADVVYRSANKPR
jgi:large subunit ribosomal protein L24